MRRWAAAGLLLLCLGCLVPQSLEQAEDPASGGLIRFQEELIPTSPDRSQIYQLPVDGPTLAHPPPNKSDCHCSLNLGPLTGEYSGLVELEARVFIDYQNIETKPAASPVVTVNGTSFALQTIPVGSDQFAASWTRTSVADGGTPVPFPSADHIVDVVVAQKGSFLDDHSGGAYAYRRVNQKRFAVHRFFVQSVSVVPAACDGFDNPSIGNFSVVCQ